MPPLILRAPELKSSCSRRVPNESEMWQNSPCGLNCLSLKVPYPMQLSPAFDYQPLQIYLGRMLSSACKAFQGKSKKKNPTRSYRYQMTFQTSSLKGVFLGGTHLGPDILEWEVKWALESITLNKVSGGDEIPAELFQILKDDAIKVLHSTRQQVWKTQQRPQDWKRSVFIPVPKKDNAKECSSFCTVALISQASKVMLKILQASLTSTWPENFQMFKLILEKTGEP